MGDGRVSVDDGVSGVYSRIVLWRFGDLSLSKLEFICCGGSSQGL